MSAAHEALAAEAVDDVPDVVEGAEVTLSTEEGDFDLTVPPAKTWKARANRALREGDFTSWAQVILSEEDFEAWVEADPTNGEVEDFLTAWKAAADKDRPRAERRRDRKPRR